MYSYHMGIVRSIDTCKDPLSGIAERTYRLADVELDNGRRVQVDSEGLSVGDRVEVQYQVFRYAVIKKMAF